MKVKIALCVCMCGWEECPDEKSTPQPSPAILLLLLLLFDLQLSCFFNLLLGLLTFFWHSLLFFLLLYHLCRREKKTHHEPCFSCWTCCRCKITPMETEVYLLCSLLWRLCLSHSITFFFEMTLLFLLLQAACNMGMKETNGLHTKLSELLMKGTFFCSSFQ